MNGKQCRGLESTQRTGINAEDQRTRRARRSLFRAQPILGALCVLCPSAFIRGYCFGAGGIGGAGDGTALAGAAGFVAAGAGVGFVIGGVSPGAGFVVGAGFVAGAGAVVPAAGFVVGAGAGFAPAPVGAGFAAPPAGGAACPCGSAAAGTPWP